MVVVPPQAAARVPVSKVSADWCRQRASPCGCGRRRPRARQAARWRRYAAPPRRSWPPTRTPVAASATMRSPSTRTSAACAPVGLTTVPPEIKRAHELLLSMGLVGVACGLAGLGNPRLRAGHEGGVGGRGCGRGKRPRSGALRPAGPCPGPARRRRCRRRGRRHPPVGPGG